MRIEIASEGGIIGPFWWRNKSPLMYCSINGDLSSYHHVFTIEGAWGFSMSPFVSIQYGYSDISLHRVYDEYEEADLGRMPKAFVNLIKSTVINELYIYTASMARAFQVQHLNNCLQETACQRQ
jgi:hypothetical protein